MQTCDNVLFLSQHLLAASKVSLQAEEVEVAVDLEADQHALFNIDHLVDSYPQQLQA